MSISGVTVSEECQKEFQKLRAKEYKYIIFKFSDDNKKIVVDEASSEPDYDKFRQKLVDATYTVNGVSGPGPRYAVYFLEYELSALEGKRENILFIAWSPDDAKPKPKMLYSSSKKALRDSLQGLNIEIQANDAEKIEYDFVLDKAKGKH